MRQWMSVSSGIARLAVSERSLLRLGAYELIYRQTQEGGAE